MFLHRLIILLVTPKVIIVLGDCALLPVILRVLVILKVVVVWVRRVRHFWLVDGIETVDAHVGHADVELLVRFVGGIVIIAAKAGVFGSVSVWSEGQGLIEHRSAQLILLLFLLLQEVQPDILQKHADLLHCLRPNLSELG